MDYPRAARTAVQQIDKFGRTVILRTVNEGVYDPITGDFTGAGVTDVSVKAVFVDYKDIEIDKTVIQSGDKRCLIADLSVRPAVGDIVVDGASEYKVVNVNTVQPGDTAILYKLQVRR